MNVATLFLHDTSSIEKPLIDNCFAMKTGSNLPFCNRVYARSEIINEDVNAISNYFGAVPFRWFVDAQSKSQTEVLQKNGFTLACSFPAMSLDLKKVVNKGLNNDIYIKEIVTKPELTQWLIIIEQVYGAPSEEFMIYITHIQQHSSPGAIRLYTGYYNNIPVATALTVQDYDILAIHWVGTVPAHRSKGIGHAITHAPLVQAQKYGATQAILMTSKLGEPLYTKMGFSTFAEYNVYKKDV